MMGFELSTCDPCPPPALGEIKMLNLLRSCASVCELHFGERDEFSHFRTFQIHLETWPSVTH